ncbi:phage antirepressor KilAC domain-containing protein [Mycobacteroides abscessus]|uniref:phage antirepressor KilAC domain-containing protein n=1 Tax=Mycobacteroides abscessus TaxID=36809 RepID=UPI0009A87D66|nr:phage antirepressor KilAC domain-containing protein [Mycobacteroides abscessus]SLB33183.1 DNA-damage-inducible protein D [Mycobacteroides abscessus subsp. massiliense]
MSSDLVAASPFDAIRHVTGEGREYWSARALMPLLGYEKWERFAEAISRAKVAARNSGYVVAEQFPGAGKLIEAGKGAQRTIEDYHLSRYACYLVALNGDPRKPEIAAAQTYFVIKTREAETATAAPALTGTDLLAAAVLEAQRMIEAKDARIAELEPKADLADTYLTAQGGSRLIREAAKLLGMREREFRQWLLDERLIFAKHAPCGAVQYDHYAQFTHYFQAHEHVVAHSWGSCAHYTLRILPRGMELITARLGRISK